MSITAKVNCAFQNIFLTVIWKEFLLETCLWFQGWGGSMAAGERQGRRELLEVYTFPSLDRLDLEYVLTINTSR